MKARADLLKHLEDLFVKIPEGKLPAENTWQRNLPMRNVAAFEASKFPVTRKLWNEIMGEMPEHVPNNEKATWNNCPDCPVTYVNWENGDGSPGEIQAFLRGLNAITKATGCTYDLPTDDQLQYMIRGDVTGERTVTYSVARDAVTGGLFDIDDTNVDEYITYGRNSNHKIQPVGNKTPNAFGIELGNVWKMSKDWYDPARPYFGRSFRGGSWYSCIYYSKSGVRDFISSGYRSWMHGFSPVRKCESKSSVSK